MVRQLSISFAGDILTRPLGRLAPLLPDFELTIEHHDIDQIHQVLVAAPPTDVLVLHASSDFYLQEGDASGALDRADDVCAAIAAYAARAPGLVIVNTLEAPPPRIVGMLHLEVLELIAAINGKLFDLARRTPEVSILDAGGIVAALGAKHALSMQNRLVMRMPYTKPALDALTSACAQLVRERFVPRKKVLVLDADNTLWGGVVGEDGVEGIAIDMQYPGSLFRRFQQQLVELSRSGIVLAMVSKNNHADVEEAFARRDMPLKLDDFASVQINWEPKSDNVARVAEELNVGLDSIIFIDDNPFELEQVSAALPEVETHRFPVDDADAALGLLASIVGLRSWSVTAEDLAKTEQYRQERRRAEVKRQSTSLDDYLRSLEIQLEIGCNRREQVKRIAQLTNKTNQFNLTTRRYAEADIVRLMEAGSVFDVRLRDRFGDMGVIGVVIVVGREIDTFLMSCRALGRGVESRILQYVCEQMGDGALTAMYIPTRKNMMVADFFDKNGFEVIGTDGAGGKTYRLAERAQTPAQIPVLEVA